MSYQLTIREGPGAGDRFEVLPGRVYTIGRGTFCDIKLFDSEVSRAHCELSITDDGISVSDLGSLNGIYVDGKRTTNETLRGGETLRLGLTTLGVACLNHHSPPAEPAIAEPPPPESAEPEPPVEQSAAVGTDAPAPAAEAEPQQAGPREFAKLTPLDSKPQAEAAPQQPEPEGFAQLAPVSSPHGELACPAKAAEEIEDEASGQPGIAGVPPASSISPEADVLPVSGKAGTYNIVYIENETTIQEFVAKHPKDCANKVFRWWQLAWYSVVLIALGVLLNYDWLIFLHVLHLMCAVYLVVAAYKLAIVLLSVIKPREITVSGDELRRLYDHELPVYTVLVPLYREEAVAQKILNAVNSLDYPQHKLDVKVLLEPEDYETIEALRSASLPACVELVVVPDSMPKTKPKACNHGLHRARGEYLVIYDAEDRPDPDQLRKAVAAFAKCDGRTICLQAKLNYYNPRQNILTRWFTVEYSTWFDLYLPGLHALGAPVPLGGTSNHFKTSVLKEIGGWDPFNVTEDCDLGIRLHKMGYKTQVLDSTTWEEANSRLFNWIRQRSRWVKGYIQTHLVHMRNPLKTMWQLRPWGFSHFLASVGGLSLMLLMNPIFWAMLLVYGGLWTIDLSNNDWSVAKVLECEQAPTERVIRLDARPGERLSWQLVFTELPRNATPGTAFVNRLSQVFFIMTVVLFMSNVFFMFTHVMACVRRKTYYLIPYALLTPFYWLLISIGAWKGFLQLFLRPFYWEKTVHGLDTSFDASPAAEATDYS